MVESNDAIYDAVVGAVAVAGCKSSHFQLSSHNLFGTMSVPQTPFPRTLFPQNVTNNFSPNDISPNDL
jgi:hypothetical protein